MDSCVARITDHGSRITLDRLCKSHSGPTVPEFFCCKSYLLLWPNSKTALIISFTEQRAVNSTWVVRALQVLGPAEELLIDLKYNNCTVGVHALAIGVGKETSAHTTHKGYIHISVPAGKFRNRESE